MNDRQEEEKKDDKPREANLTSTFLDKFGEFLRYQNTLLNKTIFVGISEVDHESRTNKRGSSSFFKV